ncbi:MAG: type II CRISPR-associated endonuclease Cas1 [Clostridia bacterium]|nr:type II CRISPR-associated endonuclease Cas1 [Clostridia bacterium]
MSWRTVVISSRCKLDLKMGYMVIRGNETSRVFLDEVAILIIENTAVSLTGCLVAALVEKKIRVIFCDEKRNPCSELVPHVGCHDSSKKIKMQISWDIDIKLAVWTEIVADKIIKQGEFLYKLGKQTEARLLASYIEQLHFGDTTNREGHAAKVYFNALFGMDFTRNSENVINSALDYGYGIILSAFNREVSANGYLTQLGLFHDNVFNAFNLSCDLMEPFRILIDRKVKGGNYTAFSSDEKRDIVLVLSEYVKIDETRQTVLNAIKIYTKSVFAALNEKDISLIKKIEI